MRKFIQIGAIIEISWSREDFIDTDWPTGEINYSIHLYISVNILMQC